MNPTQLLPVLRSKIGNVISVFLNDFLHCHQSSVSFVFRRSVLPWVVLTENAPVGCGALRSIVCTHRCVHNLRLGVLWHS